MVPVVLLPRIDASVPECGLQSVPRFVGCHVCSCISKVVPSVSSIVPHSSVCYCALRDDHCRIERPMCQGISEASTDQCAQRSAASGYCIWLVTSWMSQELILSHGPHRLWNDLLYIIDNWLIQMSREWCVHYYFLDIAVIRWPNFKSQRGCLGDYHIRNKITIRKLERKRYTRSRLYLNAMHVIFAVFSLSWPGGWSHPIRVTEPSCFLYGGLGAARGNMSPEVRWLYTWRKQLGPRITSTFQCPLFSVYVLSFIF